MTHSASPETTATIASELVKATPPVTVVGAALAGISLQDIVVVLTIIYLVLQIWHIVLKIREQRKSKKEDKNDGSNDRPEGPSD